MLAMHVGAARAAVLAAALVVAATGSRDLHQAASGGQGPGMTLAEVVMEAVHSGDVDEGQKLLLLGGLFTDPLADQSCKIKCNGETFQGDECQGKLVSKCGGELDLDFGTLGFMQKQKCFGTFTVSDNAQVDCVGLFSHKGIIVAFLEEGSISEILTFFCGLRYSAQEAYTESPFSFHVEESCEGGRKLKTAVGGSPWSFKLSEFWEDDSAFDDLFEWPESWSDDSFEMQEGPRDNKSNESDCSQDCEDSFPAPTCNGQPSDLSAECHGLFNFSYNTWQSTIANLCEGYRSPMGTFLHEDGFDVYSTCNGTGTHQYSFNAECGLAAIGKSACNGALYRQMHAETLNPGYPGYLSGEIAFCDGLDTTTLDVTVPGAGMNDDELIEKTLVDPM